MPELCVNLTVLRLHQCFSNIHSWDPDFKKSSSHASNYFASFIFVSLFSFLCYPNTCNEDSLKREWPGTHTQTHSEKDRTWLLDLFTNLRHRDRDTKRKKQTGRLTHSSEIRSALFQHWLWVSKRILKYFLSPSCQTILLSFSLLFQPVKTYVTYSSLNLHTHTTDSLHTCTTHNRFSDL